MASEQEHGIFRIIFDNSAETNPLTPIDFHTSVISGGAKAPPTGATLDAIPYVGRFRQAGERIIVHFVSDAADTIESEESDWEIPVLIVDKKTLRVEGRTTIKKDAMTGFTTAGTVDVVCSAGIPERLAYKDAPTGKVYTLDPRGKVRAYIGDDTT